MNPVFALRAVLAVLMLCSQVGCTTMLLWESRDQRHAERVEYRTVEVVDAQSVVLGGVMRGSYVNDMLSERLNTSVAPPRLSEAGAAAPGVQPFRIWMTLRLTEISPDAIAQAHRSGQSPFPKLEPFTVDDDSPALPQAIRAVPLIVDGPPPWAAPGDAAPPTLPTGTTGLMAYVDRAGGLTLARAASAGAGLRWSGAHHPPVVARQTWGNRLWRYAGAPLLLPATVLVDVVTAPVQLLGFVVFKQGVGAGHR